MATVTNFANAFETTLTADMLGTDLTAQVQTTNGAPSSPCYLVIDPHNDDKREYVLFDGTFGTDSFVTTALANRYLDGSAAASGITHAAGAIVRFAPVAQHFRNIQNSAVWLDEAQTITGAKTFSTDPTLADGSSAMSLTEGDAAYPRFIGSALTATVGTGGDYATINAALADLSKRYAVHVAAGYTVTLNLLTGFVMDEQVKLEDVDLSWITLTSADAEVPFDTSAVPDGDALWTGIQNAVLPVIDCFFRANTANEARATPALRGFNIMRDSTLIFASATAGVGDDLANKKINRALQSIHGAHVIAVSGLTIDGSSDIGIRCANAGTISAPWSNIQNCTNNGVAAASGGIAQLSGSTITNNGTNVAISQGPAVVVVSNATLTAAVNNAISVGGVGGLIDAKGADCTDESIFVNGPSHGDASDVALGTNGRLRVLAGGTINGTGRTGGTISQTANLWTHSGLIIDTAVTSENSGSFVGTGDGTTTAFTIAHGLGIAPKVYSFMPQNSVTADKHWVTVDATNITITYAAAPPSGTNNLRGQWYAKSTTAAGT